MAEQENCRMTRYPAPVLAEPTRTVEKIDDEIKKIAERMIEIMLEHNGVGLAGPQAGVGLRIFVVSLDGTKENAKVYINPELQPAGNLVPAEEGCLSLPGIWTKVRRYDRVTLTATDLSGKRFTEQAEGLLARVFQHECDHLDGMMIINRIGRVAAMPHRRRLKELREQYRQAQGQ